MLKKAGEAALVQATTLKVLCKWTIFWSPNLPSCTIGDWPHVHLLTLNSTDTQNSFSFSSSVFFTAFFSTFPLLLLFRFTLL